MFEVKNWLERYEEKSKEADRIQAEANNLRDEIDLTALYLIYRIYDAAKKAKMKDPLSIFKYVYDDDNSPVGEYGTHWHAEPDSSLFGGYNREHFSEFSSERMEILSDKYGTEYLLIWLQRWDDYEDEDPSTYGRYIIPVEWMNIFYDDSKKELLNNCIDKAVEDAIIKINEKERIRKEKEEQERIAQEKRNRESTEALAELMAMANDPEYKKQKRYKAYLKLKEEFEKDDSKLLMADWVPCTKSNEPISGSIAACAPNIKGDK